MGSDNGSALWLADETLQDIQETVDKFKKYEIGSQTAMEMIDHALICYRDLVEE